MHITLETDYAIRIVDELARKKLEAQSKEQLPQRCCLDAKAISENTNVPQRFALKILHKLVKSEIVRSYKGIYGGYELARELSALSLYDVVELMEGTYNFSRCLCDGYSCSCHGNDSMPCAYQRVFSELSDSVRDFLKMQTFDRLVKRNDGKDCHK